MSTLSPRPSSVPRSPRTIAVLRDDGTGELTINGVTQPLKATSVDEARALVLERVSAHAQEDLGGPVRLLASDPDGWWDLAVYPDGHVSKLASRPPAAKATTSTRTRHDPRRAASPPREHVAGARQRIVRRVGALVALLSVIASVTAIVLSTNGDSSTPAGAPGRPVVLSQGAASEAIAAARRDAARRAELRKARRAQAATVRAAREQALSDQAAKRADARLQRARARKAAAKRADTRRERAGAGKAAAKRADARRARARKAAAKRAATRKRSQGNAADSAPPADATPRPSTPPPPSARQCGQFDLC
jgi:hypothetical protein